MANSFTPQSASLKREILSIKQIKPFFKRHRKFLITDQNGLLLRGQNSLVVGVTQSDSQQPVIEVSTAFARGIFEPYSLVLVLLGALFLAEVLCRV